MNPSDSTNRNHASPGASIPALSPFASRAENATRGISPDDRPRLDLLNRVLEDSPLAFLNPVRGRGRGPLTSRLALCVLPLLAALSVHAADSRPLPPDKAAAAIEVEPGLKLELAAAEPLTGDPVAVAWDETGRMFVAENRGYPEGPGEGRPPAGVIAVLEDVNGDGRYDKRTEFATGLHYPNGILPWRGGVFVTDAPDIHYLKDTNSDGRADVRKVVLTGFMTNSTTQLRVSHPTLGLDGWVYVTAGLTGGNITSPEHPERAAVKWTKSDSRFHPDTFEIEAEPGQGQFGLAFDDFGRRFIVSNRNPLIQVVLHPRYLKRNPHLAFSDTTVDAAPAGDAGKVWPLSEDQTTAAFIPKLMSTPHAGTFTSACGISIYRGSALPSAVLGSAFVCEPAQNLVQRQIIEHNGTALKAHPATPGRDCLASKDSWFRPVFTANGPDGALYICDMYRKVIDHPRYLPEHIRGSLDFDAGRGMGRIYRLVAANAAGGRAGARPPAPGDASELVAMLGAPEGWRRDTAFRLLLERKDGAAVRALQGLIRDPASAGAATRVQALWLLQHLGGLEEALLATALNDSSAPLRENALRIVERRPAIEGELPAYLSARFGDQDPAVRFQALLSLGDRAKPASIALLLLQDAGDRWMRAAVLSCVQGRAGEVADLILAFLRRDRRMAMRDLSPAMEELGQVLAAELKPAGLQVLLSRCLTSRDPNDLSWQLPMVNGLASGARSRGLAKGGKSALYSIAAGETPAAKAVSRRLEDLLGQALQLASRTNVAVATRLSAIELLGQAEFAQAGAGLQALLHLQTAAEVQVAAVRSLAQMQDPAVAAGFIEKWRSYAPAARDAVLSAMLSQQRYLPALLDAVQAGTVQPWAIPANRRDQLLKNRDQAIREKAEKAFADLQSGDRMKVYADYKSVLQLKGASQNGHAIFTRTCASCHRYNSEGAQVGPDLSGVRNQPSDALLLHIIVPDAEIYPGFAAYEVEMKDGRSLTGLLASETPTSVTLRAAQGVEENILRSNIASLSATSMSLMPQELEKTMTKQELADLLAFLKGE